MYNVFRITITSNIWSGLLETNIHKKKKKIIQISASVSAENSTEMLLRDWMKIIV